MLAGCLDQRTAPRRPRVGDGRGEPIPSAAAPHLVASHRRAAVRGGLRIREAPNEDGGVALSPSWRAHGGRGRRGPPWSSPPLMASAAPAGTGGCRSGMSPSGSGGRAVGLVM
jgi:hypothetical protein